VIDLNAALVMTAAMGVLLADEQADYPVLIEVDSPDGRIQGMVQEPWIDDETLRVQVVYRPPLVLESIPIHFEVVT
jgi:hypothetical protein